LAAGSPPHGLPIASAVILALTLALHLIVAKARSTT
jgi:hypothetical protein